MAKTRLNRRKGRGGYTLIELMVALVVLSLGLFSVIQLQIVSIRGNTFAEEINQASLIALGVMEEIETQGLQWVDQPIGSPIADKPYVDAIPQIVTHTTPDPGDPVVFNALSSVQYYNGCTIASGNDLANAQRINFLGNPGSTAGLAGEVARYRVHYIAHPIALTQDPTVTAGMSQEAINSLVSVKVFVSWYNPAHGPKEKYNWTNWDDSSTFTTDEDSYCNRHMVVGSFFIAQNVM
jgi:prepilin-type N-terminal cleavage/methylation domain-containing protein